MYLATKGDVNLFHIDGRSLGGEQISGCDIAMEDARIDSLLFSNERLWIGTVNGLCYLSLLTQIDAGQQWLGNELQAFAGQRIFNLAQDPVNQIWLGTIHHGAAIIQPGSLTITRISYDEDDPSKLDAHGIGEFLLVGDEMWLATAGAGIAIVDTRTLQIIRHLRKKKAFRIPWGWMILVLC